MALRVVFRGTPDYGVPSLEALISAGYDVVGVFCQPDKPSGRGKRIAFCPVKQCALAHGIPVLGESQLDQLPSLSSNAVQPSSRSSQVD